MFYLTLMGIFSTYSRKYVYCWYLIALIMIFVIIFVFCLKDGTIFQNAVYNETVMVVEPDEGLDGETWVYI